MGRNLRSSCQCLHQFTHYSCGLTVLQSDVSAAWKQKAVVQKRFNILTAVENY